MALSGTDHVLAAGDGHAMATRLGSESQLSVCGERLGSHAQPHAHAHDEGRPEADRQLHEAALPYALARAARLRLSPRVCRLPAGCSRRPCALHHRGRPHRDLDPALLLHDRYHSHRPGRQLPTATIKALLPHTARRHDGRQAASCASSSSL